MLNQLTSDQQEVKTTKSCTTYAITWSPMDRPFEDYTAALNHYRKILNLFAVHCKTLSVFPELNLNGNLHFHMEVSIQSRTRFYKTSLPLLKHEGFVKVKTNVDAGWWIYMNKDLKMMQRILQIQLPLTKDTLRAPLTVTIPDKDSNIIEMICEHQYTCNANDDENLLVHIQ